MGVERDRIYSKGRQRDPVEARSLFCYWAVRELGFSATDLARRLELTQPAVSRGEKMAKEKNISLFS
jgi:putative transposase